MSQAASPLTEPRLWNLVADGYSRQIAPHFAKYAEDALRMIGLQPGMLIADVACGPGALSLSAARVGARVLAIDFSPEMISQLRQQCDRKNISGIDAQVGNGMKLPYPDQSVDFAFSMFGLMFFPDRAKGFQELRRILKPHGRAVVASWVSMRRIPLFADIYEILGTILPTLPFGRTDSPLAESADCCREMAEAGFSKVTVHEVVHTLEASSPDALWSALAQSTPPIHVVREHVGPDRWKQISLEIADSLRAKWGNGPQSVPMTANLALGQR